MSSESQTHTHRAMHPKCPIPSVQGAASSTRIAATAAESRAPTHAAALTESRVQRAQRTPASTAAESRAQRAQGTQPQRAQRIQPQRAQRTQPQRAQRTQPQRAQHTQPQRPQRSPGRSERGQPNTHRSDGSGVQGAASGVNPRHTAATAAESRAQRAGSTQHTPQPLQRSPGRREHNHTRPQRPQRSPGRSEHSPTRTAATAAESSVPTHAAAWTGVESAASSEPVPLSLVAARPLQQREMAVHGRFGAGRLIPRGLGKKAARPLQQLEVAASGHS